jgi:hypothetical protein
MGKRRQSRKKHTNRKMKAMFGSRKEPRKRHDGDDNNTGAIVGGIVGFAEGGADGAITGAVIGSLFD